MLLDGRAKCKPQPSWLSNCFSVGQTCCRDNRRTIKADIVFLCPFQKTNKLITFCEDGKVQALLCLGWIYISREFFHAVRNTKVSQGKLAGLGFHDLTMLRKNNNNESGSDRKNFKLLWFYGCSFGATTNHAVWCRYTTANYRLSSTPEKFFKRRSFWESLKERKLKWRVLNVVELANVLSMHLFNL